jgi:hypothetical protein
MRLKKKLCLCWQDDTISRLSWQRLGSRRSDHIGSRCHSTLSAPRMILNVWIKSPRWHLCIYIQRVGIRVGAGGRKCPGKKYGRNPMGFQGNSFSKTSLLTRTNSREFVNFRKISYFFVRIRANSCVLLKHFIRQRFDRRSGHFQAKK